MKLDPGHPGGCGLRSNAAKYTNAGGRVDVTSERRGKHVAVHVRDTGIGIAPEMIPLAWDLFTQADPTLDRAQGGLGIGLTVARRLAELHGGRIDVHSERLGKGAEFVVTLPVPMQAIEELRSTATEPPSNRSTRVLLVEDNPDAAESLAMLLTGLGHHVRSVYEARRHWTRRALTPRTL